MMRFISTSRAVGCGVVLRGKDRKGQLVCWWRTLRIHLLANDAFGQRLKTIWLPQSVDLYVTPQVFIHYHWRHEQDYQKPTGSN